MNKWDEHFGITPQERAEITERELALVYVEAIPKCPCCGYPNCGHKHQGLSKEKAK